LVGAYSFSFYGRHRYYDAGADAVLGDAIFLRPSRRNQTMGMKNLMDHIFASVAAGIIATDLKRRITLLSRAASARSFAGERR
jgi:hypothetical protein